MIPVPPLRRGDRVRIIAPSGPVPQDRFAAGLALLRARYEVTFDPDEVFAREGFLAGPDELRARGLNAALADTSVQGVWMARGGYGLMRLLRGIDWAVLRAHPKVLVGFSDGTALLAAAASRGVASVHAPVVTQLSRLPTSDLDHLWALLEAPREGILLSQLARLCPGRVRGPLVGGNLEVFSRLLGTPYLPPLEGGILFLEEVGERPYRVDRLLTHLELAGVFDQVVGVVVGEFVGCDEPAGGPSPSVLNVLSERLRRFSFPVVLGGLFGHGERHLALPYGADVELDATAGVLKFAQAAVVP